MRVTIIGSGNVAYSLCVSLAREGSVVVSEIYSRNSTSGRELSELVGANYIESLELLSTLSDLYVVAIKDGEIETTLEQLKRVVTGSSTICHTSAVCPIVGGDNIARLYPLQSFTTGIACNFSKITFFIETKSLKSEQNLITLCKILGANYKVVDAETLKVVHLAATFANNFTNRMYHYSEQILQREGIGREVLYPLISEGVRKLIESNTPARELQTGAAVRGDDSTIEAHRQLLEKGSEIVEIYNIMTKAIYDDKL